MFYFLEVLAPFPTFSVLCGTVVFAVWRCRMGLIDKSNAFGISHFLRGFKVIPPMPIRLNVTPMKAPLRAVSDACDLFFFLSFSM